MTPKYPNDPGSPDSTGPRPPKTGEPWPKRFTFTPDGSMSFVKHQDDARRGRGPRRFDGPNNRGPGGPGGPRGLSGGPGRFSDDRRPDSFPRGNEGPRPWGPPRPGAPQGAGPGPYGRPFRSPGPRPPAGNNSGGWRPPGAPAPARPSYRPSPPDGNRDRPRGEWQEGSGQRTLRNPDRPVIQSNYRRPDSAPRPPVDDRRPAGRFPSPRTGGYERPAYPRPVDRREDRPRPSRPPVVDDRTSGRSRPWSGDGGAGLPQRRLPRPQSGYDSAPPERTPHTEETPAGRDQLAARIIARATANIPADLLLRQTLSRRRQLSRADGAWISRAVFACFRWQGWLDTDSMAEERIARALSLADDFAISTGQTSDEDLLTKAIPSWTREVLDVTPAWVRSLQAEPLLWLRTRRGLAAEVASKLEHCEVSSLPTFTDTLRYDGHEDLFRHDLFQSGAFEIQDIASQAVGILCAPQPGETWWDACAGEGGKTLHLSSLMEGKGLVWSSDRAEWRLTRLKQRAGRAGCFNYRNVLWNGGPKPPTRTVFDGVLVDAPCSGIGTWGRNPHARWTTTPDDVRELAIVQRDLLLHAAPSVKPGGRLVYSVCTLSRAETTEVADAFAAAHPEFEPVPLVNPFQPDTAAVHPLCLWPQDTGGNGMFVAAWRRRPELPAKPEDPSPFEPAPASASE